MTIEGKRQDGWRRAEAAVSTVQGNRGADEGSSTTEVPLIGFVDKVGWSGNKESGGANAASRLS
jgi:hypothetical protein